MLRLDRVPGLKIQVIRLRDEPDKIARQTERDADAEAYSRLVNPSAIHPKLAIVVFSYCPTFLLGRLGGCADLGDKR